ncbi:hypothetical protein Tco_1186473 [Tanacetum coccineum]
MLTSRKPNRGIRAAGAICDVYSLFSSAYYAAYYSLFGPVLLAYLIRFRFDVFQPIQFHSAAYVWSQFVTADYTIIDLLHLTSSGLTAYEDVADFLHVPLNGYSSEQKQFSLMCFRISLQYGCWFRRKLIQKLQQKEVDEESCVKTCNMNSGEDNSVYTNYIVSSASNGNIQAEAFIFVLVGYIENVGNVIVNGNQISCSYKEFLSCNLKEYDDKGGAIVLTRWIEKMESVQDMSGCSVDQIVKYTVISFVGKALTWWNSQI